MGNSVVPDSESRVTPKKGQRVLIDLTGRIFERLTVIDRAADLVEQSGTKRTRWNCQCKCGIKIVATAKNLTSGNTRSCGCLQKDVMRGKRGEGNSSFKHGHATTREYQCWTNARRRTSDPRDVSYERYGARGIKMCDQWLASFEKFYEDMGDCPKGMSLERIDNSLGYSRENCRWATDKEQVRNRRSNVLIRIGDEEKTLVEWSEISGIDRDTIRARMLRPGWDNERSVFAPVSRLKP